MNDIKNSARLIAHTLLSHIKQNEDITDEIFTSIINPMNLGIDNIPLKKGMIIQC